MEGFLGILVITLLLFLGVGTVGWLVFGGSES